MQEHARTDTPETDCDTFGRWHAKVPVGAGAGHGSGRTREEAIRAAAADADRLRNGGFEEATEEARRVAAQATTHRQANGGWIASGPWGAGGIEAYGPNEDSARAHVERIAYHLLIGGDP